MCINTILERMEQHDFLTNVNSRKLSFEGLVFSCKVSARIGAELQVTQKFMGYNHARCNDVLC